MLIKSSIRNYNIEFSSDFLSSLMDVYNTGDIIIIDENVHKNNVLMDPLPHIKINASEETKSYEYVPRLLDKILGNFNKSNKLIAIGGGITQDLTSFVSSILFRGIDWTFFPTTLLAQGDSCIGGKTSINYKTYKNQLGNFNPPNKIIICDEFLKTLSDQDIRSGLGEMLHFYLVDGKYEEYKKFENNIPELIQGCLKIKKRYIEKDEFDTNERLLLNYGHTFGHALESITNYGIPHGIAVTYGMHISNYVSYKLGYISKNKIDNLAKNTFKNIFISEDAFSLCAKDEYIDILKKDKKNINSDKLRCVLTRGFGKMFLKEISYNKLKPILKELAII
jgi:3-dehydroquinate synthase